MLVLGIVVASTTTAPQSLPPQHVHAHKVTMDDDDSISQFERHGPEHWTTTTVNVALGVIGIAWVFWGWCTFKPTLFAAGFLSGGCIGGKVALAVIALDSSTSRSEVGAFVTMILFGLVSGFAALRFFRLGLFCCGAVLGVVLGSYVNTSFIHFARYQHEADVFYGTMALLGLLGGLLSVCCLQRHVIIHATSFSGAYFIMHFVGYWIGGFPDFFGQHPHIDKDVPKKWWGYFAGTIALYALGIYVQYKHTGRKRGAENDSSNGQAHNKENANSQCDYISLAQ